MSTASSRVLHLLNDVSSKGNGLINTAVDIAIEQASRGSVVAVCSGGGEYVELLQSKGVTHYVLDQRRKPATLIRAFIQLTGMMRKFKPDIVHCHMVTSILLAWAAKPFVQYRLISHLHNVHQRSSKAMKLADRVIAVSRGVADYMATNGVPKRKIATVVSGSLGSTRLQSAETSSRMNLLQPAIVTVAGMNHRKGITDLISAFEVVARHHQTAHLYLVGDGPNRKDFEQIAYNSPFASRIHFEGFAANPLAYMLAADVFVLASLRESLGLVLIEARECGCAIVATNVDGIPEALDYGKRGVLVPPSNVSELASGILTLLTDRVKHSELKAAARENLAPFTVSRMVDEVLEVYQGHL